MATDTFAPRNFGERKIATILFADIQGSLALIAGMDPERVDEVLSEVIGEMRREVRRYGGTVNRVAGDGIMAIFGAPLAQEHHAKQACHAALAILANVQRDAGGDIGPIRVRVGLHSGEVVVRHLANDTSTNYEAMGEVVSIAARMEQAAEPGTAIISDVTRWLAGDDFVLRSQGVQPIKGLAHPMELFELIALRPLHEQGRRASLATASPFVGRRPQLADLLSAWQQALAGNSRAIAIVGEAGAGKSRLVHEFLLRLDEMRPLVVRGQTQSFGQRGYQLIISMMQAWLGIAAGDGETTVKEKIAAGAAATATQGGSGDSEQAIAQALTALCNPARPDPAWLVLDPTERRNRIAIAVCTVLCQLSRVTPLVIVAEDLHWADPDSIHVLKRLSSTAADERILLVMTYRDDPDAAGLETLSNQVCRLGPLNDREARELLRSHLVDDVATEVFEASLVAHTGGNPLFIEECLLALSETGAVLREGSRFRPSNETVGLRLPVTIRALISARVDRLRPVEKDILQAAAVIGQTVSRDVLILVVDNYRDVLAETLDILCAAHFLVPSDSDPDPETYEFRHALTREAVYRGILSRQRAEMHARVVAAIERLHHNRVTDYAETLAEHAQLAEDWRRAVEYFRQSARKAIARSANRAAVTYLESAQRAADHLPQTAECHRDRVAILLELRFPLFKLGRLADVAGALARAAPMARELDDPRSLALLYVYQSHIIWVGGGSERALAEVREAIKAAERIPDRNLAVRARFQEGMILVYRGEHRSGITALSDMLGHINAGISAGTYPDATMAGEAHSYIARAYSEIGEFHAAGRHAEAARNVADRIQDPFCQAFAALCTGVLYLYREEWDVAIKWLERSRERSVKAEAEYLIPLPSGFLGMARIMAGAAGSAVGLLEEVVQQADRIGFRAGQPYRLAVLARSYRHVGRTEVALHTATEALEMARAYGEVSSEVTALHVLADIMLDRGGETRTHSEEYRSSALEIAQRHGLGPLVRWCSAVGGTVIS
jgi:class 3 adenylate cyclase/tetratricopeptide (TPR) repeat protein